MGLMPRKTISTFVITCLLGGAYVAAKIANTAQVISYQTEDAAKLAIVIILCVIGFVRGRDFLQFTRTTPLFAVGSLFVIAYHLIQLAKEVTVFHGMPLLARDSATASVLGETLLIGVLCLFLCGILFSVSRINEARQRLEASIAEQKRSEDLIRMQRDLAVSLGSADELEEGLGLCLEAALHASGLDCGGIYLHDERSGCLHLRRHVGLSADFIADVSFFDGNAANTQLVMGGRALYTSFASAGIPLDKIMVREGLLALAVIPIIHRNTIIGCLNVASHSLTDVPTYSRNILEIIASQIGRTIIRLRAEEGIRREHELLDRITNTSPAGIILVGRDGRITFANPRAQDILGLTRAEITERTYNAPAWNITDYDGGPFPDAQLPFHQVMTTGQPVRNVRHAIEWSDGHRVLLCINAAPLFDDAASIDGIVAAIEDVTEQVRTERALQASERRFRAIIEHSADIFSLVDAQGNTLYDSPSVKHWFGYEENENMGRNIQELIHPDDWPIVRARFEDLVTRGGVATAELRLRHKDGSWRWIEATATNLLGNPDIRAIVVTYHEITERRRTQEALRESEERYRLLLQNANDAVYVHELSQEGPGQFLEVNERACQLLDYTRDEFLRMSIPEIDVPEQRARIPAIIRRLYETGSALFETEHLARDGRRVPVEISARLFHLRGRPTVLSFVRDITDRRRVERTLWESKQRMDLALRGADLGTWDWNVQTGDTIFNERWAQMLGYAPDEIRPHVSVWEELIHPDDLAKVTEVLNAHLRGETDSYTTEHRLKHKSGHWVWVLDKGRVIERDADGRPVRACGTHLDITERKQVEEALARSEEKFSRVFRASPAQIGISRLSDGRMIDVNESLAQASGYCREEIIGRTSFELGFWADPTDRERLMQRMAAEGVLHDYECRFRTRDGRILTTRYSAEVVEIGGETCLLSAFVDVTERKQAEEKLRAHERQLRVLASELALAEERERRRIAGELHDHACQSLVLAKMRLDALMATLPARQADAFRGINSGLNKTIESVRELTFDLSSPTLYKFGLEAALEELLEDKFRLQKDVERVFSDDHLPKPLTDDVQVLLFQSVREILINIIKHARARRIGLDIKRMDGSITIAVTDDGVGFDVDEVFSLPARHRGFGLFNIKERLDYIGGILEISSRRGEGSRFVLVAPLKVEGTDPRRNDNVGPHSAR